MFSVTYIGAIRTIQTVTSPSRAAAVNVLVAMRAAGYRARLWHHGKAGRLTLLA